MHCKHLINRIAVFLFIKVTFKMTKICDFTRIYAFHLGKRRLSSKLTYVHKVYFQSSPMGVVQSNHAQDH